LKPTSRRADNFLPNSNSGIDHVDAALVEITQV
jgi:hypothetical protein